MQFPNQIYNQQIEQYELLCIRYTPPSSNFVPTSLFLAVYRSEESTNLIRPKRVYNQKQY